MKSIPQLLKSGLDDAEAIAAPGQQSLSYRALRAHVVKTVSTLNQLGIERNDPVAIVLSNGPLMASAFVSIAAGATAAPLNPACQREEFDFYLSDLDVKALLVEKNSATPAKDAAHARKIPVLELVQNERAGLFDIFPISPKGTRNSTVPPNFAETDDFALLLHTSGTTSRPKLVALSHRNVCTSVSNICQTLQLTSQDRCLNIMPLFHIHGLMAPILASLSAGASVFCAPGFNALKFFSWLEEAQPTWYSAVPTMHQAILLRARKNRNRLISAPLRFIRSSSSSLPPQVLTELESIFKVPVIESYAMTEAAHQMSSNPLPPLARKPGTVGVAAGPEIAIMDDQGRFQQPGTKGEIVIRGANVISGYANNPEANAESFIQDWFRTGDQGVMDEEGYLSITGRLKEIINRGGEKISPREVEETLLDHPAVEQVVTFAIPHDKLGEEVAAAIVLKEGTKTTESEIRAFARSRLAHFKIPRIIRLLDEIPKSATGKLKRIGLAKKLGLG